MTNGYIPPTFVPMRPNGVADGYSLLKDDVQSDSRQNKGQFQEMGTHVRTSVPRQTIPGERRGQMKYKKMLAENVEMADAESLHSEHAAKVASPERASTTDFEGIAAQVVSLIEQIRAFVPDGSEQAAKISGPLKELENRVKPLAEYQAAVRSAGGKSPQHQAPTDKETAVGTSPAPQGNVQGVSSTDQSAGDGAGGKSSPPHPGQFPGQISGQSANPMDYMNQMQDKQNEMFQQQMAMQESNQAAQLMMSSFQQISQTVTAFTQAANADTSAMCNTMLDGVKAISELDKKGGAAMVGAIGN